MASGDSEKGLTASVAVAFRGSNRGRIGAQRQCFMIRFDGAPFAFSVLGREMGGHPFLASGLVARVMLDR